jgi:DNA-binding NarL/FixJ family response regulator
MKSPDTNTVIKVAIADDHTLFRTGVKTSFHNAKTFKW